MINTFSIYCLDQLLRHGKLDTSSFNKSQQIMDDYENILQEIYKQRLIARY